MTRLLVLGAGPFQVPLIEEAQRLRLEVVAADADPAAPGLGIAEYPAALDIRDVDGCLALARDQRVAGVTTVGSEVAVRTMGVIAEELGLPGPGKRASAIATNKASMREALAGTDVVSPRWEACDSVDSARVAARELGFPLVVKPTDRSGSRGVTYVDNASRLDAAAERALGESYEGRLLLEEFVKGVELSVEGFAVDGRFVPLGLSDKTRTHPPFLLDTEVAFPSSHPAQTRERACLMTEQAVEAIGLRTAAIHAELMVKDGRIVLIELAARGPGFNVFTHMLPWVTELDVVSDLARLAVGWPAGPWEPGRRGAVLRFLSASPGRIREISGVESARRLAGVLDVRFLLGPGDVVNPLTSGADRVGYVIAVGASRAEAEDICERVAGDVKVSVDESLRPGRG